MPSIGKGTLIVYRLFDVASEIDLLAVERMAREGTKRLRISKQPYMKALEFANPPVSFDLPPFQKNIFGHDQNVGVVARAYDFGVVTVAFYITIPGGTAFEALEEALCSLDADVAIDERARQYIDQIMDLLASAIKTPDVKEDFVEDYTVIYVESLGDGMKVGEFTGSYDITRLLHYERRELSAFIKAETMKHAFSYYPDEMIVLHVDNAFILDPVVSTDLPDLLEFANAQILELRYYDGLLDRELEKIYSELPGRRTFSVFRVREYERLARKLMRTVTDVTEVTEKVHNALKVTEDIYYAKIYRDAMALLGSGEWERSINGKLRFISDTYGRIHDDIVVQRGYVVEVGIFILIAVDIVLVLLSQ